MFLLTFKIAWIVPIEGMFGIRLTSRMVACGFARNSAETAGADDSCCHLIFVRGLRLTLPVSKAFAYQSLIVFTSGGL
jgi:hypothetical protein